MLLRFFLDSKRSKGALRKLSQYDAHTTRAIKDYSPLGDEEDSLELELTLNGEVLDGEVILPVVGQALVESGVLVSGNVLRVARPDGLRFVEFLVLDSLLLDRLGLLLLVLLIVDLLDLGFVLGLLGSLFLVLNLLCSKSEI